MIYNANRHLRKIRSKHRRRSAMRKVVGAMCCVVVFCVTYALILPAITLSEETYCGLEEHTHAEECYETRLICGFEETELAGHVHGEDCYEEQTVLICGLEESAGHIHDENCVGTEQILICEQDHEHSEDCYETVETYICGKTEGEDAHTHTPECYETQSVLICGIPEGEVSEEPHVHTEDCYEEVLICQMEEHTHSEVCFAEPETDFEAAMREIYARVQSFGTEDGDIQALCLDAYTELCGVLDSAYDAFDSGQITVEELTSLETLFDEIIAYMRDEYGFDPYGAEAAAYSSASVQIRPYVSRYDPDSQLNNSVNYYTRELISADTVTVDGALSTGSGNRDCLIPVSWLLEQYGSYGYSFDAGNPGTSPFVCYHNDDYHGEAKTGVALTATGYVQEGGIWYVRLTSGSNVTTYSLYYAVLEKYTDTVTPSSTVIHMFDYWTTTDRADSDNHGSTANDMEGGINAGHALKFGKSIPDGYGDINYSWGGTSTPARVTQGIVSKTLGSDEYPEFSGSSTSTQRKTTNINQYLGKTESLAYLFDPTMEVTGKASFPNVSGILCRDAQGYYSYDCTERSAELDETTNHITEYASPAAYVSAGGSIDTGFGYGQFFPFNSARQSAMLQTEKDPINHYFGMSMTTRFIQEHEGYTSGTKDTPMTFEFSGDNDVWIFIDGVLVADLGGLRSAASVTINFATGAVTITDSYGATAAVEDKSTTIKDAFEAAQRGAEWQTNEIDGVEYTTFKDGSTHTLKFFYLERGNYDSNIKLKFNLTEIPPTSIYKVNQYGDTLVGATFAVYAADKDWNYIADDGTAVAVPKNADGIAYGSDWQMTYTDGNNTAYLFNALYSGTTNNEGEMVFLDADGMPYSLSELQNKFGDYFILREVDIPNGYRTVSDDTYLYIEGGLLKTADPYGTGVWASPNAQVTASNTLHVAQKYSTVAGDLAGKLNTGVITGNETDGYEIDYYDPSDGSVNGTLFAVVLKRNGAAVDNVDVWSPIYGSDTSGYTVIDPVKGADGNPDYTQFETYGSQINAVIAAANIADTSEEIRGENIFHYSASGMQAVLEHMPGKIDRYFTYLWNQRTPGTTYQQFLEEHADSLDPQYFVAYYWTSETSLTYADETNTVRVVSREGVIDGFDGFTVQWGSTIEVPNMENRLYFQKLDEFGNLEVGATFALYPALDAVSKDGTQTYVYYVGTDSETNAETGNTVYVALLSEDQCTDACNVAAFLKTEGTPQMVGYGTYRIDGTSGIITVEITEDKEHKPIEKQTFYVFPAKNAEGDALVGSTHKADDCKYINEEDVGHFLKLNEGSYYLREISAPPGYAVNTENIPVLVNKYGVYAYAGSDDGTETGTADNGVDVGNGIGYLCKTMDVFASVGEIDETLTWVYATLLRNDTVGFSAFDEVSGDVVRVTEDGKWHFVVDEDNVETAPGYGSAITLKRSEAMVTYLTYNGVLSKVENGEEGGETKRTIFDYTPTADQAAEGPTSAGVPYRRTVTEDEKAKTLQNGQNTIRLFVKSGWSDLAIYQDYDYGLAQTSTTVTTNYDPLTEMGNISNLFSSSTFVRVTDQHAVDLNIEKVGQTDTSKLKGAEFVLSRGSGDTAEYYGVRDGTVVWGTDRSAAALSTTGADGEYQAIQVTGLTPGSYTLEEIKPPDGYKPLTEPVRITVFTDGSVSMTYGDEPITNTDTGSGWKLEKIDSSDGALNYTLTVPNSSSHELPNTGGAGTTLYTTLGLLLIAAAGVYGYRLKRENERKTC